MMTKELIVGGLGILIGVVLAWGFRTLPSERWQVLAVLPRTKTPGDSWIGTNLTFYGLISGSAYAFATAIFVFLAGAIGADLALVVPLLFCILPPTVLAAKYVARIVEGKSATFTVGGAVFVGSFLAPAVLAGSGWLSIRITGSSLPILPLLSAMAIAYVFGEGVGRLACLSFGCCYGKPLSSLPSWAQPVFRRIAITFHGKTKKICYAGGLEGVQVVPIQAITSVIFSALALVGLFLFLGGHHALALVGVFGASQCWRSISEFLRGDFRGGHRISAYQIMAPISALFSGLMTLVFASPVPPTIDLHHGMTTLWSPVTLFTVQIIWLSICLFTGWSKTTGGRISFHVHRHRI